MALDPRWFSRKTGVFVSAGLRGTRCGCVFLSREGFLCLSTDADARPTRTQIEHPDSPRVARVVVDGVECHEGAVGDPQLPVTGRFALGADAEDRLVWAAARALRPTPQMAAAEAARRDGAAARWVARDCRNPLA